MLTQPLYSEYNTNMDNKNIILYNGNLFEERAFMINKK